MLSLGSAGLFLLLGLCTFAFLLVSVGNILKQLDVLLTCPQSLAVRVLMCFITAASLFQLILYFVYNRSRIVGSTFAPGGYVVVTRADDWSRSLQCFWKVLKAFLCLPCQYRIGFVSHFEPTACTSSS